MLIAQQTAIDVALTQRISRPKWIKCGAGTMNFATEIGLGSVHILKFKHYLTLQASQYQRKVRHCYILRAKKIAAVRGWYPPTTAISQTDPDHETDQL